MSDPRKLVYAIVKFLKSQLEEGGLSGECAEGVEVGIQCLEQAYNIGGNESSLDVPFTLQQAWQKYLSEYDSERNATPEEKAQAESLKQEGNNYMNQLNFSEAVAAYTKAIRLDPKNPVYYSNRAAASNKLGQYTSAIKDCEDALKLDPTYSKAYARLGLAYNSLNKPKEAAAYYKKALELEPDNESFKSNLKLAEEALANPSNNSASLPFQNVDLSMLFSNPNLLSMASQMLANPSMQSMMSNILTGNMSTPAGGGMEVLLHASQQLAQQMENENPQLVEELRRHMGGAGDASRPDDHKPSSSEPGPDS